MARACQPQGSQDPDVRYCTGVRSMATSQPRGGHQASSAVVPGAVSLAASPDRRLAGHPAGPFLWRAVRSSPRMPGSSTPRLYTPARLPMRPRVQAVRQIWPDSRRRCCRGGWSSVASGVDGTADDDQDDQPDRHGETSGAVPYSVPCDGGRRDTAVPETHVVIRALTTLIGGTSTPRTAITAATNPARVGKSTVAESTVAL